ncbi:MAG: hypothetical protein ACKO4U_18910 [Caldilinea sp.]
MNYLTSAQVLFIHARLIVETGGAAGLRDLGLLEAAVARPQATFDGADLYPDVGRKPRRSWPAWCRAIPLWMATNG